MKFYNVKKQNRVLWTAVNAPTFDRVFAATWWCDCNISEGRYYRHYTNTRWWFEYKDDALLFKLMGF